MISSFYLQNDSQGSAERTSSAATEFVRTQIRHNREAKKAMKKLDSRKTACECGCGGSCAQAREAGVDTLAAKISKVTTPGPNDKKVGTYRAFELHAVLDEDGEPTYYYAKHRTLGNMGHANTLDRLKRTIDRTLAKTADQPVMVSGEMAGDD